MQRLGHRPSSQAINRWISLAAIGLFALSSAACRGPDPAVERNVIAASEASIIERDYRLNPGDELQVTVFQEQGLDQKAIVRPDGMISFPLAGHVRAAGQTTQQLEAALKRRLGGFVQNPQVTVSLVAAGGYRVYVIGQVQRPGPISAAQPLTVMQALSLAGGLTPFGDEDTIIILRNVGNRQGIIRFNYAKAKRGADLEQNITLRSGDVIVVRE